MYLCRYVPPHRVGFLYRFGLKTGIHFALFGLESGMVFEGTTECMNVFIVSIPNEWERKRNMRIRNGFEEFFCLHSNLSKRVWILDVWSENGCGKLHFWVWNWVRIWRTGPWNRAAHPHQEFPGVPHPPSPQRGRGSNNCHFQALDNNIVFPSVIVLRCNWHFCFLAKNFEQNECVCDYMKTYVINEGHSYGRPWKIIISESWSAKPEITTR